MRSTLIEVTRAMGDTAKATAMEFEDVTAGFDDAHKAMQREVDAGKTLVEMLDNLAGPAG